MTFSLPSIPPADLSLPVGVSATTDDPGLRVVTVPNLFSLLGECLGGSTLFLTFDMRTALVPLTAGMKPSQIFELIESSMPRGYEALARATPGASDLGPLVIQVLRSARQDSLVPRVRILDATDRKQRVYFMGNNRILIAGTAIGSPQPARLRLDLDGRRVELEIKKGDSARRTAKALSAALPPGYRALLETRESDVSVTVYRHTP